MRKLFLKARAFLIIALLLFSQHSSALNLSSNLSSETLYTNNSGLTSTSTLDEVVQTTGLNLTVREDRKNFQTDVAISLTSEKYLNDTFADSTSLTTGLGVLNFDIIESFLNWNTNVSRSEILTDSAASDTPDNRSIRTIFRSGPGITYVISRYSTLGLSADYINIENEDENISDSERFSSDASYTYIYDPLTRFQLGSEYNEILDSDGGEESNDLSFSAGFTRIMVNGEVVFRYTLSQIETEGSAKVDVNSFYFSFSKSQLLYHDFVFVYQEEITDRAGGYEFSAEDDVTDPQGAAVTRVSSATIPFNGIIKRDQASLNISRALGSFNYSLNGFWEKEDSLESFLGEGAELADFLGVEGASDSKEISIGGRARLEQQYSPFITLGLGLEYRIDDFVDRPEIGKDRTKIYGVDATYALTEDLSLNAHLDFNHRSNNQDGSREYEEFSTSLGLVWRLF